MTPGSEREAFLLWMSSSEKSERERITIRKEAISILEKAIGGYGRDAAHGSLLMCTLRRWRGTVAREEGNLAGARFEFLQGRSLAESHDPGSMPWFDAAIMEAEVWEAFGMPGLEIDALRELVEKLDRTSALYGMAGDRSNVELTADWSGWFRFFLVPAAPTLALVSRIVEDVKRMRSGLGPREAATRFPLGYVFMWSYFWISPLARQVEALLRNTLGGTSTLEELMRGASVLVPPTGDFEPLLKPDTYRRDLPPASESPDQLSGRIKSDLDAFHAVEKNSIEYASTVQRLWDSSTHQKKREVEHVLHPGKQRR